MSRKAFDILLELVLLLLDRRQRRLQRRIDDLDPCLQRGDGVALCDDDLVSFFQ
jgi:hypothetical protein